MHSLPCIYTAKHPHFVIPAQGVTGVSHSALCACLTVGLCRSQRALQGGIQSGDVLNLMTIKVNNVSRKLGLPPFKLQICNSSVYKLITKSCALTGFQPALE